MGVKYVEHIETLAAKVSSLTKQLETIAKASGKVQRLKTMPGVGLQTALAIEAFATDMSCFERGRDFGSWLGLVPMQHSTGGKDGPNGSKTSISTISTEFAVGFHSFGFLIPRFFSQFALRGELLGGPVGKQRFDFRTVLVQLAFAWAFRPSDRQVGSPSRAKGFFRPR